MRVYLCMNQSQGLTMWRTGLKNLAFKVYTQKQEAIKAYKNTNNERIKEKISSSPYGKYPIIVFLLDIPDKDLKYISGDELEPIITEYTGKENIVYELVPKKININEILSYEVWHYYIRNKRLKHKRTRFLYPLEQKK